MSACSTCSENSAKRDDKFCGRVAGTTSHSRDQTDTTLLALYDCDHVVTQVPRKLLTEDISHLMIGR